MTETVTLQEERQMPKLPEGHLFEFCSRDYWESLGIEQLVKWVQAVSGYINDLNHDKYCLPWGLSYTLGDVEIDFAGSGRVFDDFKGKNFAATDLCEFLCWASQRLVWMDQATAIEG